MTALNGRLLASPAMIELDRMNATPDIGLPVANRVRWKPSTEVGDRSTRCSNRSRSVHEHNDRWNVMIIEHDPGQLYMGGTMAAFTGPPPFGWCSASIRSVSNRLSPRQSYRAAITCGAERSVPYQRFDHLHQRLVHPSSQTISRSWLRDNCLLTEATTACSHCLTAR